MSHINVNNVVEWRAALFCLFNTTKSNFSTRKRSKQNVKEYTLKLTSSVSDI